MHVSLSIAVHPSNDNVAVGHLSVRRQSEADPSRGLNTYSESNVLLLSIKAPVELVVSTLIQNHIEAVFLRQLAVWLRISFWSSQQVQTPAAPVLVV